MCLKARRSHNARGIMIRIEKDVKRGRKKIPNPFPSNDIYSSSVSTSSSSYSYISSEKRDILICIPGPLQSVSQDSEIPRLVIVIIIYHRYTFLQRVIHREHCRESHSPGISFSSIYSPWFDRQHLRNRKEKNENVQFLTEVTKYWKCFEKVK